MSGYSAIDLSLLPVPDVVETLDYEVILAAMKADLAARAPDLAAVLALESEPLVKLLEVCAYREVLIRARVNDAAQAVTLARATGTDLDNLAALFGVARLVISPGNTSAVPPVAPTLESDADLRRRAQLALEGFSTAGPEGAYVFHALSADADVLDVSATSPSAGDVLVTVLSRTGSGTAPAPLLATVQAALNADDVRPLCDNVVVQSAAIVSYAITATLYFYPGPDSAVVMAAAQAAATAYAAAQHRIGRDVTISGLHAALHQPGVQRVVLTSPSAALTIGSAQASWCTAITLINGGVDE
ncbi:MAG: baseplate J/gp47 family protein [Rhodobacter sp.]|nr:baseplate J/gp47 family protein [Rhodobacter sp.]MCA3492295.1 baseplate J/gp47 family protein [Rhodobacter sp.]MCA3500880.1 baseplate J/gp47 family protein [Rhodobacter sp.]MCA3505480.1 baseplate J/gp47 family protein [Rhodobacter sp.]MCA3517261.1 baseplate J/gp47 family protein [Rhodobacter sp.]